LVLAVRGTKKFLDRVGPPEAEPPASTTALGDWYATVLFWKPHVALFVNELTLLPVLTPFAPARTLLRRFSESVELTLSFHGLSGSFISAEVEAMSQTTLAKTANRSLIGMLSEFAFLAERWRANTGTLLDLSIRLSDVPCGPLSRTHTYPRRAVAAAADEWILGH
jgi:hypothetical protein